MKGSKWMLLGVAVVGGLGALVAWGLLRPSAADPDGDGRGQVAEWLEDAKGGYLSATATTVNPADGGIEMEIRDASGKDFARIASDGKGGMAGGSVDIQDDLPAYPPGARFTVVARYYDARHTLLDTESVPFSKP
jgi:hypothetical protein